jgi:short-subunit dehydrogenase
MTKKTIVITGASSGIGRALAMQFASLGHHVIALGRQRELLETLQKAYPLHIEIIAADITKDSDRRSIQAMLPKDEKGIFLIHNAGIAIPQPISALSEELWEQHHALNIKAPLFLTQVLLPHLKNGGRILNISSGLAHTPMPGMAPYGISKAALLMMKEYFNTEFKADDVYCASAMPGIVDTGIQTSLRAFNEQQFPSVATFRGFFNRSELLSPATAAKFLSWLLLTQENETFSQGDWNIYDNWHHKHWATPGEVVQRQKTPQEQASLIAKL